MAEWQPIETAPRDGSEFLVCNIQPGQPCFNVVFFDEDANQPYIWGMVDSGQNYHREWPTHWMPLPDPPAPPKAST